jgi:WD40 repeat protein
MPRTFLYHLNRILLVQKGYSIMDNMDEQAQQVQEYLSRRSVLQTLAGVLMVPAIAGCSQSVQSTVSPSSTVTSSPTAQTHQQGHTLYTYSGHKERVTSVDWSRDGKRIVSGSLDKTVQVWDATFSNAFPPYIYHGHTDQVLTVGWGPDSQRVVSGGADKTVQMWDALNGENVTVYRGHSGPVMAVAWSPDGRLIASGSTDGSVRIWDVGKKALKYVYRGHSADVNTVAWSADSKHIASGSTDKTVQIFDAETGKTLTIYRGHSARVSSVSWSPDGTQIASASWDKTVQVWNAATGAVAYTYNGYNVDAARRGETTKGVLPDLVFAVAWSHNGKRMVAITQTYCGDNCAVVVTWDAATGKNVSFYPDFPIFSIAWSPDDTRLVSAVSYTDAQISRVS